MNIRLLCKLLGILSALIGGFMIFSLPWAMPGLGHRSGMVESPHFDREGFQALLASIAICFAVASVLLVFGRQANGKLFRKEAMAVVGLSWILATILGAMPFYLSGTGRGPSVKLQGADKPVLVSAGQFQWFSAWKENPPLLPAQYAVLQAIVDHGYEGRGLPADELIQLSKIDNAELVFSEMNNDPAWSDMLVLPGEGRVPSDRASNYRIRWQKMTIGDALFESQSGFSTTGATVISELEDEFEVPLCIHFWRASTHFLGGLGIIVLFVVLLGQGSSGKVLMRTEMPGPTSDGPSARMQHSAWTFAGIYIALNIIQTVILMGLGMSLFDGLCHAFSTMATGGFSTYNASLGHFTSPAIQYVVIVFMILAGSNFTLLYLFLLRQPGRLLADVEWRTYIGIIVCATVIIVLFGMRSATFVSTDSIEKDVRDGLFQVVSVMTTTGFVTDNFDAWNHFGRLLMLLLMFVGGCAGSTGGGLKVIRHVLMARIFYIEIERVFHPRVVRPLRLGGTNEVNEQELRGGVLVYMAVIVALLVVSWLLIVAMEPDFAWGEQSSNKLIDTFSGVASTLNNVGPGLGIVGPIHNYGDFSGFSKIIFVWLMMLGRLEVWPVLVLFSPRFWKDQ